jgi:putative cofactor-binding repeat protein
MLDNCTSSCIQFNSGAQTLFHLLIANNLMHLSTTNGTGVLLNAATSAAQWLFNVAISGNTIDAPTPSVSGMNIFSTSGLAVLGNSFISTGGSTTAAAINLQNTSSGVTHCTATGNASFQFAVTIANPASCVVAGNTSP